jgi:glutaredoxin 3
MPSVKIYTTSTCPYCHAAKALLAQKGVAFDEVNVSDPTARQAMTKRAHGRTSVPQIFIDDTHVGGYDDMAALDRKGALDVMLEL